MAKPFSTAARTAGPHASAAHQRFHQARGRFEQGQGGPAGRLGRPVDQRRAVAAEAQVAEAPLQRQTKPLRAGPLRPGGGRNALLVNVDLLQEREARRPAPANGRVHHLHQRAQTAPDQHEVSQPPRLADHQQSGQGVGLGHEQVIHR